MSDQSAASNNQIPTIRSFQFDKDGIGAVKNSVNLFRGDVNFSLPLVTLQGRGGLEVAVSALLRSNVQDEIERWSLTAPTSIVGLGWALPFDRIERVTQGSASLEDDVFFLVASDNRLPLLRSALPWSLFSLPESFASSLAAGQVTSALRAEFADNGIPLSQNVTVDSFVDGNAQGWILSDAGEERAYRVLQGTGDLPVEDGGLGFETQSYQFWQIRYYPLFERWMIIKQDGNGQSFGGLANPEDNVLQWGVRWSTNWQGASKLIEGQERFPVAWNLAATFNPWGDRILYTYEVVEQPVGDGGLSYTKACYTGVITDSFGRTVTFEYDEKDYTAYDPAKPETARAPREYADPHKAVPSLAPNAFQDRYETRYLTRLVVRDLDRQLLFTVHFDYETHNFTRIDPADPLYGDTVKRVLTGINQTNVAGESLPGLDFTYYTDPGDPHPGAIHTITYPQGGAATYVYEAKDLPICERSLPILRPTTSTPEAWVPRVWFGPDYAVVAWYNTDSRLLQLTVYTWLGFWYPWSSAEMTRTARLDLATLAVVAQNDYFAVTWESDTEDRTTALLFHKRINTLGQWDPLGKELSFAALRVKMAAGDQFLVALDTTADTLHRLTWDWALRRWNEETFPLAAGACSQSVSSQRQYFVTAQSNYYLLLCYDRGGEPGKRHNCLRLHYLDALNRWHEGGTLTPDLNIAQLDGSDTFFWAPGATFAVATYLTQNTSTHSNYNLEAFHWDASYQFTSHYKKDGLQALKPISYAASVVGNSFVGSGPHLFRYNGRDWQYHDLRVTLPSSSQNAFWFGLGNDVALMTQNGAGQIISTLGVFDPDTDSLSWQTPNRQLANITNPLPFQKTRYYPTVGADYLTLDSSFFFRGTSNVWSSVPGAPIYTAPTGELVDTTTTQDQAPSFIAYLEYRDVSGKLTPVRTRVVNLENGRPGEIEDFDEQVFRVYDLQGRPESGLSGKFPAGPDSLFTFPLDKKLDEAPSITLRRHIRGTVDGTIRAFPVVRITIDTGYEQNHTGYEYDESTAVCDPSGQVVKFFRAWRFAGDGQGSQRPEGSTEMIYINGLPTDHPTLEPLLTSLLATGFKTYAPSGDDLVDNFSVLDGFLKRQNTYDAEGLLVSAQQNEWQVRATIETADGTVLPIRGTYVLNPGVLSLQDGVETATESQYDLSTGQPVRKDVEIYNGAGQREVQTELTTYACQVYPDMRGRQLLTQVAQTLTQVQVEGAPAAQATGVVATRWKTWDSSTAGGETVQVYASFDQYTWQGGPGSPDFSDWDPSIHPGADWLLTTGVTARSPHGLIVESENALSQTSSNLYDRDERYLVATFTNASLLGDEASYLGFEDYEQDGAWSLAPSGRAWRPYVLDGLGHTGRRCLNLSAGTTGADRFERTFTPATQDGHFLFSAWYRTAAGFSPDSRAGWTLTILRGSTVLETLQVPFEATGGRWVYVSRGVDLAAYAGSGSPLRVTVAAANPTAPSVYLDDVRWSAFLGTFNARVYNPRSDQTTAALGPNAETTRSLYDDFQRPVGSTGPDENVTGIGTQYLSRQAGDRFVPDFPNSTVQIQGSGRGFYSDFLRDGDLSHWSTAQPGQWRVAGGQLVHDGTADGSIRLAEPAIRQRYAAYVLASPAGSLTRPLGLRIGDRLTVRWNPGTQSWEIEDSLAAAKSDGSAEDRLATRRVQPTRGRHHTTVAAPAYGSFQREWLLVVAGQAVLFFADGEMIFSQLFGGEVEGELEIFAGDPVSFHDVIVSEGVRTTLTYSDATGNPRQDQALAETRTVVAAKVYDSSGRPAVATKPAPFSPTAGLPLLAYRPRFVESLDWTSGVMTGEVARYYSPGGGGSTDDQGYPYRRERYEASPLGRVIERGLPGKTFAIADLGTTPPAQRHTLKLAYGTTTGSGFLSWLPPGEYFVTTSTDADGNQTFEAKDKAGTVIGDGILLDATAQDYLTTVTQITYGPEGQTATTLLPNYFAPPDPQTKDRWKTSQLTDMRGQVVRGEGPDNGVVERVFDPLGNLRFQQTAEGQVQGYYLYFRYDALGRPVESGYLEGAWDRPRLQGIADTDPSWPATPSTWEKINTYDGDGSNPLEMSRLLTATTSQGDATGTAGNRLHYRYDASGNVVEETLETLPDGTLHPIGYEYDNLQNVTRTLYLAAAAGTEVPEVTYHYDQLGKLRSVGSGAAAPEAFAVYAYNADGSVASQRLRPGTAAETLTGLSYNSPGWVTDLDNPRLRQKVYYTQDPGGAPGYYNGQPAAEEIAFGGSLPPGAVSSYAYRYRFDPASRLTQAEATSGATVRPEWSLGLDGQPVTYDDNGNFEEVPRGGDTLRFVYDPGTDKVKNTRQDQTQDYSYDRDGAVTAALPRGISLLTYGRVSGLTRSATAAGGEVRFEYDAEARRIRKSGSGVETERLSIFGTGDRPLVQHLQGTGGTTTVRYVYSPAGLLGFFRDGRFWLVLADSLGSSRALVADDGTVGAVWSYLPFGEILNTAGSDTGLLPYLFTGQELDAELGLYNFLSRLYDPNLGRFYSTDPASQFASPYVYSGNNPVQMIDPSGRIAFLAALALSALAGLVIGAVAGGAGYTIQTAITGEEWDWGKFGKAVGVGAIAGAVGGAVGFGVGAAVSAGAVALGYSAASIGVGVVSGAIGGAAGGAAGGVAGQLAGNAIERNPNLWEGVGQAAIFGAVTGAVLGGLGGGMAARTYAPSGPRGVAMTSDDLSEAALRTVIGRRGSVTYRELMDLVPEGTPNTWAPSANIRTGYRYDFTSTDGTQWTIRFHSPQRNIPQYNSGQMWTAKIERYDIPNRPSLLSSEGGFGRSWDIGVGSNRQNNRNYQTFIYRADYSHIPFRFF